MILRTFSLMLFLIISVQCYAQQQISISLFPGYHKTNSNDVISFGSTSKVIYIFGSTVSARSSLLGFPMEVSVGYSWGKSILRPYDTKPDGYYIPYKFNLWHQTVPIEALYIHQLNKNIEVMGGLNFSGQYRKLFLKDGTNKNNEHLFRFGIGLTGKIQSNLKEFKNGKGAVFVNLTARWTEFLIDDADYRSLNNYTLRHLTLAPQIGFLWNFAQPNTPN